MITYTDRLQVVLKRKISECPDFIERAEKISGDWFTPYTFSQNVPNAKAAQRAARRGGEGVSPEFRLFKTVFVKTMSLVDAKAFLEQSPDVEKVEEVPVPEPTYAPADPYFENCWHLLRDQPYGLNLEEAWDIVGVNFGEDIIVATVEPQSEGCRYTHEDFGGSQDEETAWAAVLNGTHPTFTPSIFNGAPDRPLASEGYGHNTMTASDVGARISNGKGFSGTAPRCKVMLTYYNHYVLEPVPDGVEDAIVRAADQGADIISLSLTGNSLASTALVTAVNYALSQGVLVVWAMGANSTPADYVSQVIPGTIWVSSHDASGNYWYNYGFREHSVPGINIWRSSAIYEAGCVGNDINSYYRYGSGNSNATPLLAGVAALLLKKNPTWNLGDVRQALRQGCVPLPGQETYPDGSPVWNKYRGWGAVNAKNSLSLTAASLDPIAPMKLRKITTSLSYKIVLEWDDPLRTSKYDHTVVVRRTDRYPTAIDDGTVVYSGTARQTDIIWQPNGTYYYAVFNVDTDNKVSKLYGDPSDATLKGYTSYYTINNTLYEAPVAEFEADTPTTGYAPFSVTFDDKPLGRCDTAYYLWDFGDGETSTERNPVHVYTNPGTYTVSYTCGNPYETDTITKTDFITVEHAYVAPTAAFTITGSEGMHPLIVQFTDQSTGDVTGWLWDFGDGETSTEQNPTHEYNTPGTYTVTLTVSNPEYSDSEIKPDSVVVHYIPPVAAFTITVG